jgi:hypothetical protein
MDKLQEQAHKTLVQMMKAIIEGQLRLPIGVSEKTVLSEGFEILELVTTKPKYFVNRAARYCDTWMRSSH